MAVVVLAGCGGRTSLAVQGDSDDATPRDGGLQRDGASSRDSGSVVDDSVPDQGVETCVEDVAMLCVTDRARCTGCCCVTRAVWCVFPAAAPDASEEIALCVEQGGTWHTP